MFEAVNAIIQRHKSYKGSQAAIWSGVGQPGTAINPKTASVRAALASAACDTLAVLYKNKISYTKVVFNRLELVIDDPVSAVQLGAKIGSEASKVVLATRKYDPGTGKFGDGSKAQAGVQSLSTEPRFTDLFKGPVGSRDWDIDPISQLPVALGGHWNEVMPFVVADLHLPPGPPAENDPKFKSALDAVRRLGGDPASPALGLASRRPRAERARCPLR